MVGWSRRNSESRRRRARWWASLTPEQRQRVSEREAEFDKKLMWGLAIFCVLLGVADVLYEVFK